MSEDLKVLFPEETVEVAGEQVKVHPFFFGQIAKIAKFCRPIVEALLASGIMTITKELGGTSSTIKLDTDFVPKLFQILDEGSEPLFCLIAYAVAKPRVWLDTIAIDEGILLSQKIWEVNADFFVARVMPILAKQLTGLVSTGETSSPASSDLGIAEPT